MEKLDYVWSIEENNEIIALFPSYNKARSYIDEHWSSHDYIKKEEIIKNMPVLVIFPKDEQIALAARLTLIRLRDVINNPSPGGDKNESS